MSVVALPTPPPKPKRKRTKKTVPLPSKWSRFKESVSAWIQQKKWRTDIVSYLLYFNNHLKELLYAAFLAVVISLTVIGGMRYLYPRLFLVEVENLSLTIQATDGQTYVCRPR